MKAYKPTGGTQSPEMEVHLYSQLISTRVPSSHDTEATVPQRDRVMPAQQDSHEKEKGAGPCLTPHRTLDGAKTQISELELHHS